MSRAIKIRFLSHVKVGDGCWEWTASLGKTGKYGIFRYGGAMRVAHRVSYQLFVGSIPMGLCVCHACDNRRCVRPSHLWIGTRGQNNTDRKNKGRNKDQWSDKNSNARLNWDKVGLIRQDRASGISLPKLANKYGVGTSTVHRVVNNMNWIKK